MTLTTSLIIICGFLLITVGLLVLDINSFEEKFLFPCFISVFLGFITLVYGFICLSGEAKDTVNKVNEEYENITNSLVEFYGVNDKSSLIIKNEGDNKYTVELLNGRKDLVKINLNKEEEKVEKVEELIDIEIIDSSMDIK